MLSAVEGQHARADNLRGREPGVVDREAAGITHRLEGEIAARHDPPTQHRHPRHRFAFAQPRQNGVWVAFEIFERDGSTDRE